jgi:hypothetical protein
MSRGGWWRRIPVIFLAFTGLEIGLWIQLAPRSFFDEFPGLGHRWVASFAPYNEHLLRDFGAMNLALGLLAVVAAVRFDRVLVRVTCALWFVFGVQHLAFHLAHFSMLEGIDKYLSPGALVAVLALSIAGWFLAPGSGVRSRCSH